MADRKPFAFSIERVTDPADIPMLASIFDEALKPDPFYQMITLYSPESVYDSVVTAMTNALADSTQYVFKAVVQEQDDEGMVKQTTVGISQWSVGYISIPKVDPFESKANPLTAAVPENSIVPVSVSHPTYLTTILIMKAPSPNSRRSGSPYPAFIHLFVTTKPSRPPGFRRFSPNS